MYRNKLFDILMVAQILSLTQLSAFARNTGIKVVSQHTEDTDIPGSSVVGKFYNRLNRPLVYQNCTVIGGRQTSIPVPILKPQETEHLVFEELSPHVQRVTGNCYYLVPINRHQTVILDILFYRSAYWGHEWYGMSNHPSYDVWISIPSSGSPGYYIFDSDSQNITDLLFR